MSGGEPVRTLSKEILKQAYGNLGNKLYQLSAEEIAEKERLQKAKESRAERRRQLRCNQAEQESTRKLAEAEEAKRKLAEQEEEAKRKIMEEDETHRRAHALLEEERKRIAEEAEKEERKRIAEEAEKEKRKREEFELEALRLHESKLQQEAEAQRLRKEREEQEQVQLSLMLSMVEERLRSEFAQEKQQIIERMAKDAQSLQQQAISAQSKLDAMEHRNKQVAQEVVNADRIAAKLNGTTRDEPLFSEKDFAAPETKPSPPPLSEEEELKKKQREELAEQTALIQRNAVTAAYIWLNVGSRGVESVNRFFGKPIHTDGFHTRINTALAKGEFNHALKRLSQEQWAKEVLASPVGSIAGTFLNQLLSNHLDNVMTLEATGVCGYRQRAAEQTQQEMKAAAGGTPPQPPPQQQAATDTTKHNVGCTCEKCLALYKHILDTQGKPHPTGCTCNACLAFYQRVLQSGTSSSSSSSSSTPLPRDESKVIEQLQQQCHMLQNQMEQQRTMYEQMQLQQEKALKERELLFQEQQKQFLTQLRQLSTEKQEQEKLQLQKELERLRQDQRNKEEKEAKEAKEATEQLMKQQEEHIAKAREVREAQKQQDEEVRRKKQAEEEEKQKKVEEEAKRRKQKEEEDILQEQKRRAADEERDKLRLQKLKEDQAKEEQAKLQKQKQDDEKEKQGFRGFQGSQGNQGVGILGNQEKLKEKEEVMPSDSTPSDLSHLLASFRPVEPPILAEQPSTYGRCRYADHMDPTYESGARSASQERSFSRELVQKYHRHRSISPPASSSQTDVVVDPVSGKQRPAFHVTPRSRGVIDGQVLSQLQKHAYTLEPMFGMVPELMTFMNGGGTQALTTSG